MIIAPETRVWRPNEKPSFVYTQAYGLDHRHFLGPAGRLAGCWMMNEGSGNQVYDVSRNQGVKSFTGGIVWRTDSPFCPCLRFNPSGDNDYIDLTTIFNPAVAGTVMQWIKPRVITETLNVSYCGGLATDNKRLYLGHRDNGGTEFFILRVGSDAYLYSTTNPVVDTWYCVAGTFVTGGVTQIYVNGILENSGTHSAGTIGDATERIGAYDGADFAFDGNIALTYVWTRVLSGFEMALLYHESFCMIQKISFVVGGKTLVPVAGNPMLLEGHLINSPLLSGRLIA